jgi:hypothetical protein
MQLMLELDRRDRFHPVAQPPKDLVQALADLLLEALSTRTSPLLSGQEASNEPKDHA